MAYRLAAASTPFLRFSIGTFSGYNMRSGALSAAALVNRNSIGSWQGVWDVDDGTDSTSYTDPFEFTPLDNLGGERGPSGSGVYESAQTFTDTTNWMIIGFTTNGGANAGDFIWYWKTGASGGSWGTPENETRAGTSATTAGSGYRHIVGNVAPLGDNADYDITCIGAIKTQLSQATFQTLDESTFQSWFNVFGGSNGWLIGFNGIGTLSDSSGNGGNEVARSAAGISTTSDPAGWDWTLGGGAGPSPNIIHSQSALQWA